MEFTEVVLAYKYAKSKKNLDKLLQIKEIKAIYCKKPSFYPKCQKE